MKTPEQIKAWLEAQPWYGQLKERVMSENDISDKAKRDILDGKRSIYTLVEGVPGLADMEIWLDRNVEFTDWFINNEENSD